MQQARVAAAIRRSTGDGFSREREHRLLDFSDLMEPNPRSIKLLAVGYGTYVAHAMAGGVEYMDSDMRDQLVLWTILSMRFPVVSSYLETNPDALDDLKNETPRNDMSDDLKQLLTNQDMQKVLRGIDLRSELEVGTLEILVGSKPWERSQPNTGNYD